MPERAKHSLPEWATGFGWSFVALVATLVLWVMGNAAQLRGDVYQRVPLIVSYTVLSFDIYAVTMSHRKQRLVEWGRYNKHQDIVVDVLLVVHLGMYVFAMAFDIAGIRWTELGPVWLFDAMYIGFTYVAWTGAGLFLRWTAPERKPRTSRARQ